MADKDWAGTYTRGLLLNRVATAQEALDIELINRCVPADEVDAEVDKMVTKLQPYDSVGTEFTTRRLTQYMMHSTSIVGMEGLYAEEMVFSHQDFAKKIGAYAANLKAREI